ncbi:MAG: hypothetical protein V4560_19225 [Bacteroidota bacterium]
MKNYLLGFVAILLAGSAFGQKTLRHFLLRDEGISQLAYIDEAHPENNWYTPIPTGRDIQLVGNGRVLVGTGNGYEEHEITTGKKVFELTSFPGTISARRLKNGNTLITDERDWLTREVSPNKETVWEFNCKTDLPAQYQFTSAPQSCTRLANGNTIFTSRGQNGKGPQMIEVTKDKKVVWVLHDWKTVGDGTAVQVLDDPGIPEIPGQSEH